MYVRVDAAKYYLQGCDSCNHCVRLVWDFYKFSVPLLKVFSK